MVASPNGKMQRVLQVSMVLTAAYVGATFYFGLRAHSLALISEAGHNISDLLAIALSFVAVYFQARPATDEKTFGYQRAGVLAAFVNAVTLVVLSAWIAIEAIHRLGAPVAVQPRLMMYVAAAGVLMNGTVATLLWRFSGDVNIRSVFLHMLGDTLVDGCGDRGRRGDPVQRDDVDRSGAVDSDCGDDSVEFGGDHSRDAEHSAGRNAAGTFSLARFGRRWLQSMGSWMFTICMCGVWVRSRMLWRAMSRLPRCRCLSAATFWPALTALCAINFASRIRRFSLKRRAARPPMGAVRRRSLRPLERMATHHQSWRPTRPTERPCPLGRMLG